MPARPPSRYDDSCASAHAMELLGDRWALLVVRELMLGPRRFSDLRAGLPGISANVLTQRLEDLEVAGVVVRRILPPPAASKVYELTPWGYDAEPIFQALGRWAVRSPFHDRTRSFSLASLVLSLRTMFDPARAGNFRGAVALCVGPETFVATVRRKRLSVERAAGETADATLSGDPPFLAQAIHAKRDLDEMEVGGLLSVDGDRELVARFAACFPGPDDAPAQKN